MRCYLLLAVGALPIACGNAEQAGSATVTDSAGIRIVQIPDVEPPTWRLGAAPDVEIGAVAGDAAYQFDRIMGLERLSDGRWVVGDMGSGEVRFYERNGRHLMSVGRPGEGPGEFRQILGLVLLAGDTLAVMDAFAFLHLIEPGGTFAGTVRFGRSPVEGMTVPVGAFSDGTVVARSSSATPQLLTEPHTMTQTLVRSRYHRDGAALSLVALDTVGTWKGSRLVPGWRGQAQSIEFDLGPTTQLMSHGIAAGFRRENEIRLYDAEGNLNTILRRHWTPIPVGEEHIARRREQFINSATETGAPVPDGLLRQRTAVADQWTFAPHLPAFSTMAVDDDDNLWLRDYVPAEETVGGWSRAPADPTHWTVLSPAGQVLGRIELPARFRPFVFGDDIIGGIWLDETDVEFVRVYRVMRDS